MTDQKPTPENHSTEGHTGPEDNRGLQPGLLIGGIFAAAIGMGLAVLKARAGLKSGGQDNTPPAP